jgi:hypothetical protein
MTAILMIPGVTFAAGYHAPGNVSISPNSYMQGNMSVRFNTGAAGSPYVYATGYAG